MKNDMDLLYQTKESLRKLLNGSNTFKSAKTFYAVCQDISKIHNLKVQHYENAPSISDFYIDIEYKYIDLYTKGLNDNIYVIRVNRSKELKENNGK